MPRAGGEGEGRATRCPGDGSRWRSHGGTVCADRTSVGGGPRGGGKSGAEGGSRAWATLGAPRRAADRMGLDFRTGWPRRLGRRPRGESGLSRGAGELSRNFCRTRLPQPLAFSSARHLPTPSSGVPGGHVTATSTRQRAGSSCHIPATRDNLAPPPA